VPGDERPDRPEAVPVREVEQEELSQDSVLAASEPMVFRNQGTLFALAEEEADHVLSLLVERDLRSGDGQM
jgi:hypothetical protein